MGIMGELCRCVVCIHNDYRSIIVSISLTLYIGTILSL
jgi:hypothetical protein